MISPSQPQYLLPLDTGEYLIIIRYFDVVQHLSTVFCVKQSLDCLQVVHKLLLLLEDVLQLTKSGLHLLQRELVLALSGLVLGHPGVELGDGVVEEHPLLRQDLELLHPAIRDGLDLVVSLLQASALSIGLSVSRHLLRGRFSSSENFQEVDAVLVESLDLVIESLDLVQGGRLGETLGGRLLRSSQPGGELLDAGPVLGPELDVVGVLVAPM